MEIQFITDARGKRKEAIIPFEEWERTEKAKDILEHIYLSEIINERKGSESTVSLDEIMNAEGLCAVRIWVPKFLLRNNKKPKSACPA